MASTVSFYSASYDKIQSYIDSGTISALSYVLCKDEIHKNELIFVDKDLQMRPVVGYEQNDILFVDELPTEQYRTNAFYVCKNVGYLYINGIPVPVFKEIAEDSADYDSLSNAPVVNKYGSIGAPVVLCELDDGSYAVQGQYQIGGSRTTVYVPSKQAMFLVDSDDQYKYITKLDAKNICIYTVELETMNVVEEKYATHSWVTAQGYVDENFVNQAIEDLYNRIAEEAIGSITKLSQLENDMGFLTENDMHEIDDSEIIGFFNQKIL